MSRRLLGAVLALVFLAPGAVGVGATQPSTTVLPGWPRHVGAGTVLPGPQGGVVVVSVGDPTGANEIPFITTAVRRDGTRLWRDRRVPGCGNCDSGRQAIALQADGTYGPIGYTGDDFWSVDAAGRERTGCSGVVTPDGTCYFLRPTSDAALLFYPQLMARTADGADLWSVTDAGYRWYPEFSEPPVVVRDEAGLLYTGPGAGVEVPGETARQGRLIVVDPSTRAIVWTRPDISGVLSALRSGVLAVRADGLVSLGPDGTERWSLRLPAPFALSASSVAYDAVRDRLYVAAGPSVVALRASTGTELWRTRPADRAQLLSVGRSGRVYVHKAVTGRNSVRALRIADGSTAWERRTGLPVLGAAELADGSVAVSAGRRFAPTTADRLTLLRPR